jgi:predicted AlkP superfamily phosphohydrolase/phosphomutase
MLLGYIDPGSGMVITGMGAGILAFLLGSLGAFILFSRKIFFFLRKRWKMAALTAVALLAAGLIFTGVIMNKENSIFDHRFVILGFDGLSPAIAERMMSEGNLPNFSRLRASGSYRHLDTTNPSQSPVAWAGFATGRNPGKNGMFGFIRRDPRTYGLALSLSKNTSTRPERVIRGKCFWNYTSEKKVPTVIISCPVTFPPDKIYGKMLSGMGVPDILGTEGTFTFYTTDPLPDSGDTGGKVFNVTRSGVINMDLIGPRIASFRGRARHTLVPLKARLHDGKNSAIVEYQGRRTEIFPGQWSPWQEVSFKLGPFREAKGIFRFYLVEASPGFRLYISPINFDPRSPFFPISHPGDYSRELAGSIGLFYTQGMPMDTWAVNENRLTEKAFLEQANEVLREKKALLDLELDRLERGVLFCYFESSDIIQHMFWRYMDPEHPLFEPDAPEEYKKMIDSWYMKMDVILGDVMSALGENDILVVMSDHGFGTFRRAAHINSWLRANGYLSLVDRDATSGRKLLSDIDWKNTRAYAIGFGAIYINQEGRERDGIVLPGRETEQLKEEISVKLAEWRDEISGKPVISAVYSREEIFWGAESDKAPDLYAGFTAGYRASWQTALGAVPEKLLEDNLKKWSGSHLFDPRLIPGVVFANRPITRKDPSIYDIAPTVLKAAGYSDGDMKKMDLDGKPLF